MPIDIAIDENLDSYWDDVGDIGTVTGSRYVQQAVVITVIELVGLSPPSLTPTDIESHRGDLESAVDACHATSGNPTVSVGTVDHENGTITYHIQTSEATFPITVSP